MSSPNATLSMSDHAAGSTPRPSRRERRRARRRAVRRTAGLVGALALGVTATAAGVSLNPAHVPEAAGAAESTAPRKVELRGADLVSAQRKVAARPVEAVLVTHAETVTRQQHIVAAVAAAQAAAHAEKMRPKTGVDWDGIAACETGGNWSMQGSTFSGGVGFANSTWSGFGGREFAPNAGQATREQQIVVAERVYARYGLSGWGCKHYG
jgi:Transglycosylase-like domain